MCDFGPLAIGGKPPIVVEDHRNVEDGTTADSAQNIGRESQER